MRRSPRVAIAALAGLTLLIAIALVLGWYRGELLLPARGFQTLIRRATNPLGFYALAACYAVLAGVCGYLLMLIATAGQSKSTPRPSTPAPPRPSRSANLAGSVAVIQDGRSGRVVVTLAEGSHAFWWEFGGGNCVAIIAVPDAMQWSADALLASYPRSEFLHALAREVARLQCPNTRYAIGDRAIEFHEV